MSATNNLDTVRFTTKGRVVIPMWLRKQFQIGDGTKAVVQATSDGILLTPATPALIRQGRGVLKRKTGGKAVVKNWAAHRKSEQALEDRHVRRARPPTH